MILATETEQIRELRAEIWKAAEQDQARIAKVRQSLGTPQNTVYYWQRVLINLQQPKRPSRKAKYNLPKEVAQRYIQSYRNWQKRFPHWVADGHTLDPRFPDVFTDKGLKEAIKSYLTWEGHFANITDNKGTKQVLTAPKADLNGKLHQVVTGEVWHRSSSKNGQQDIDANLKHPSHPFGIPWKIEAKTPNDKRRKHQDEYGKEVSATGAVYSRVWGLEDFFKQYDELMLS